MSAAFSRALPGAALLSLLAGGLSAQAFEGVVTWQMGVRGQQVVQSYKAGLVRTEMGRGNEQGTMILDGSAGTMTILMPSEKMYMVMSMQGMSDHPSRRDPNDKPPSIRPTGRMETIAGRTCEVYLYAEAEGEPDTNELCVAKGMGYMSMASGGGMMGRGRDPMADIGRVASNPTYARVYRDGFFPLRISKIEKNKVVPVMVATSVEPKSLDAGLFKVPDGYTQMTMPGAMPRP